MDVPSSVPSGSFASSHRRFVQSRSAVRTNRRFASAAAGAALHGDLGEGPPPRRSRLRRPARSGSTGAASVSPRPPPPTMRLPNGLRRGVPNDPAKRPSRSGTQLRRAPPPPQTEAPCKAKATRALPKDGGGAAVRGVFRAPSPGYGKRPFVLPSYLRHSGRTNQGQSPSLAPGPARFAVQPARSPRGPLRSRAPPHGDKTARKHHGGPSRDEREGGSNGTPEPDPWGMFCFGRTRGVLMASSPRIREGPTNGGLDLFPTEPAR